MSLAQVGLCLTQELIGASLRRLLQARMGLLFQTLSLAGGITPRIGLASCEWVPKIRPCPRQRIEALRAESRSAQR
jgi:hypothetical protein